MVAKFCSRSHGQPVTGVRSAAMISISREISREGVMRHQDFRGPGFMPQRAGRSQWNAVKPCRFPPIGARRWVWHSPRAYWLELFEPGGQILPRHFFVREKPPLEPREDSPCE